LAIKSLFIYPPHLTSAFALPGKHRNVKIAYFYSKISQMFYCDNIQNRSALQADIIFKMFVFNCEWSIAHCLCLRHRLL